MRQFFPLNKTEQWQEWTLVILALLSFIVIGFGIFYQNHNIDNDFILLPVIGTIYFFFFLILGTNGLKNGNLLPKWTPFGIFGIITFLISKLTNKNVENVKPLTAKVIGILDLTIGLFLLIMTFVNTFKGQ